MKYWKYSPGSGAYYWDYCRDNSLMAIGWQDVGDLSQLLFFDEFDTLGKERGDVHETGEIKKQLCQKIMVTGKGQVSISKILLREMEK